jgi:hypothetical protein
LSKRGALEEEEEKNITNQWGLWRFEKEITLLRL